MPSMQPNLMPLPESLIPNQLVLNQMPNYLPAVPSYDYGIEAIYANPMPTTTIIQDSTVANNLANALQLLVVSNLLSNTLPVANEIVVPAYPAMEFGGGLISPVASMSPCNNYAGYNYVY